MEGDYKQLEFRVAGFLSKDKQVYKDVKNNVDVHQYTADTMNAIIYQSTIRPYQVAQLVGRDEILLKKKDKSSIKFYNLSK